MWVADLEMADLETSERSSHRRATPLWFQKSRLKHRQIQRSNRLLLPQPLIVLEGTGPPPVDVILGGCCR